MKRMVSIVTLATVLLAAAIDIRAIPAPLDASGPTDVWERYMIAKKRYQFDLYEITADKWWDLESTLRWQRDQQLTMIELRNMQFRHLAKFYPGRIDTSNGLSRFANFDWTEADSRALRGINPDFAKLETFLKKVNVKLENDSLLPEALKRSLTLPDDLKFMDISMRLSRFTDDLDSELSKD